jgi:hypothetical protein
MSDFEQDLKRTLQRRKPPRDLTPRIMARIGDTPKRRWPAVSFAWRPALAAAAVVLTLAGGIDRYRDYRKGQEAKEQLMLALQITAQKISIVQQKVEGLNRRSIGHDQ